MPLVPPNNQPGAAQLSAAVNGENGLLVQPGNPKIIGGPQNVIYAPVGFKVTDEIGNIWIKSTDGSVATGWKKPTVA